jgi:hypothetical protein
MQIHRICHVQRCTLSRAEGITACQVKALYFCVFFGEADYVWCTDFGYRIMSFQCTCQVRKCAELRVSLHAKLGSGSDRSSFYFIYLFWGTDCVFVIPSSTPRNPQSPRTLPQSQKSMRSPHASRLVDGFGAPCDESCLCPVGTTSARTGTGTGTWTWSAHTELLVNETALYRAL